MDDMIEWKFMIEMDDWNGMNGMQCMSIVWNIHTEQTYTEVLVCFVLHYILFCFVVLTVCVAVFCFVWFCVSFVCIF